MGGQPFVRSGVGPCVFAYLKPIAALDALLARLVASHVGGMIYLDGVPGAKYAKYQNSRWRLTDAPIDIRQAAAQCDAAITNANPGSPLRCSWRASRWSVCPRTLSNGSSRRPFKRLGTGVTAYSTTMLWEFSMRLAQVLSDPRYAAAARDFAACHHGDRMGEDGEIKKIVDDLEGLLTIR